MQPTNEDILNTFKYHPLTGTIHRKLIRGKWKETGSPSGNGYLHVGIKGKMIKCHRLAWFLVHGVWPNQIDHINGIGTDNRISNLRDVTCAENGKNRRINNNNKSGTNGVWWSDRRGKWYSAIKVNGKTIFLGSFTYKHDAISARKAADTEYSFHENHGKQPTNQPKR